MASIKNIDINVAIKTGNYPTLANKQITKPENGKNLKGKQYYTTHHIFKC